MISADDLLAAPRGRSLCLAIAAHLDDAVWSAAYATRESLTARAIADFAAVLARVDPAPIRTWSTEDFVEPVDYMINLSMGWQEPDESDAISTFPQVADALRPVAEAILAAPGTRWWHTPVELSTLRCTSRYDEDHPPFPPDPPNSGVARDWLQAWRNDEMLEDERARAERRDDPTDNVSGTWWSTPNCELRRLATTRYLSEQIGSVRLVWEEDSFGEDDALIWKMEPAREPRVYEIGGPTDWAELTRRYPLDVSWSRRQDWYRCTGRDGRWQIPDFAAVAGDFDAVHLTVAGYLTTAIRAVDVDAGIASVLAGWDPDQTWWLGAGLSVAGEPEHWRSLDGPDGSQVWQRVPMPDLS